MKKSIDNEYLKKVDLISPKTDIIKNSLLAFIGGGCVCLFGEIFFSVFIKLLRDEATARTLVSITFIVITAILTGIGIYDKIAKKLGAGLSVPISGFANSVCSPAIEYAVEGHILGTAEKMFSLAGAVIVYGCSLASLYGFIYYFFFGGNA